MCTGRVRMVTEVPFSTIVAIGSIPTQKSLSNLTLFPAVLQPSSSRNKQSLLHTLECSSQMLDKLLEDSGAVLIRGFELQTAEDFNEVMESIGWEDFPYGVGGEATRKRLVGKVYTANDGIPLDKPIGFHNEVAYLQNSPSKIVFFCQTPPKAETGGATCIVHGRTVYERLLESGYEDFLVKLQHKGVRYSKLLAKDGYGSWKFMFQTDSKVEAEQRAAAAGSCLEWLPDGRTRFISSICPGVKINPLTGEKVWFNTIAGIQVYKATSPPGSFDAFFGDGEAFPADFIDACMRILDEEKVDFPWQKGDVLIVNNMTVLHARQPSKPPRTILVSLCK